LGAPHVTLYVRGDPAGISVPDVSAFESLRVMRLGASGLHGM
jgi:hypothetical protein